VTEFEFAYVRVDADAVAIVYGVTEAAQWVGKVGRISHDEKYWYATPGKGNPLSPHEGTRAGFRSREAAAVYLAGVADAGQAWLIEGMKLGLRRVRRENVTAAVRAASGAAGGVWHLQGEDDDAVVFNITFRNGVVMSIRQLWDREIPEIGLIGPGGEWIHVKAVTGAWQMQDIFLAELTDKAEAAAQYTA